MEFSKGLERIGFVAEMTPEARVKPATYRERACVTNVRPMARILKVKHPTGCTKRLYPPPVSTFWTLGHSSRSSTPAAGRRARMALFLALAWTPSAKAAVPLKLPGGNLEGGYGCRPGLIIVP